MRHYTFDKLVLGDVLEERANAEGRRTFLKFHDGDLTYGEVNATSARMAQGFADHGVRQYDHVAVMLLNCPEFLYTTFALARLGAVIIPINPQYKGDLLLYILKNSDASFLVVDETLLDRIAPLEERVPGLKLVLVHTANRRTRTFRGIHTKTKPLSDLLSYSKEQPKAPVKPHDLQAIMFTSGTTGPSKGVMTPHAHALTDAQDSRYVMDYHPDETIYCPLPLFHAAALWDGVMTALLAGASIAIVERFSASRFWTDVRHFNAHVAMGVFAMIPILLNQPPAADDRQHPLRCFYVGKSALDQAFRERFGVRSVETYTSTEVGIGTMSPYGHWRAGSCGQANELTHEVKVVDEFDREVGPGEPGQLVVRPKHPFVMTPGYYKYPQATADCFRNLWFHTGDRAYRDKDGYFYFIDRIKDSIRRRGENISAFELERAINAHPSVVESAAFGVPSELEEDEIKVAVVCRKGTDLNEAELAAYCQEQLPSFMTPRYIEFVEELPKTPTGKVLKHELRRQGNLGITSCTWDTMSAGSVQRQTPYRQRTQQATETAPKEEGHGLERHS